MAETAVITGGAGATASFGPVLFFGLTAAALITHTDPYPFPNPQEEMDLAGTYEQVAPDARERGVVPTVQAAFVASARPDALVLAARGPAPIARSRAAAPLPALNPFNPRLYVRQTATRGYGPLPFPEFSPPHTPRIASVAAPAPGGVPVAIDGPYILDLPSPGEAVAPVAPLAPVPTDAPALTVALSSPEILSAPAPLSLVERPTVPASVSAPWALGLAEPRAQGEIAALKAVRGRHVGPLPSSFHPVNPPQTPGVVASPSLDAPLAFPPRLFWGVVTGYAVNFRAGPGLEFESVTQFDAGARLIVTDEADGWARVNALSTPEGPLIGWMSRDFLELDP